ncbi:MAG: Oxidoreductase [Cyanobacteria bacterium RYN_339]|nr:Oxidoreductase [Cyanobacteria bacterium RYN_339]
MAATSAPIRVGVIGAGRIGKVHAANLAYRVAGAELAAVADPVAEAARETAAQLRLDRWTADYREILADKSIQAVVIASSTDTHARLIEEAAAAGKDVFCEKPIDLDLARVDAALAAVKSAGTRLQIGFNRRFDPSFARARAVIAEGGIGTPQLIKITSRDPQPASIEYLAVSGGLFTDMTIHDFDVARWLVGDEVVEISAMGAVLVDPAIGKLNDVDTAIINLRFKGGALGNIDNSRKAVYGYDVRVEVFGSAGSVLVGNHAPNAVTHTTPAGSRGELPMHWFIERFEQAYLNEMAEFVACIREGRAPSVGGEDGRAPLLMAQAAWKSLREGRTVALEA